MLLKVDRVASTEEALLLEELGIREMSFVPETLADGLKDGRILSLTHAEAMMSQTPRIRWGVFVPYGTEDVAETIPDLLSLPVQFIQTRFPEQSSGIHDPIEFVASCISANYDEDPLWTAEALFRAKKAGARRFIVEVYETLSNGWNEAIKQENPYDELKEADVRILAEQYPILVSSDFRPEHLEALHDSPYKGINWTLSPWQHDLGELTALLRAYNQRLLS